MLRVTSWTRTEENLESDVSRKGVDSEEETFPKPVFTEDARLIHVLSNRFEPKREAL